MTALSTVLTLSDGGQCVIRLMPGKTRTDVFEPGPALAPGESRRLQRWIEFNLRGETNLGENNSGSFDLFFCDAEFAVFLRRLRSLIKKPDSVGSSEDGESVQTPPRVSQHTMALTNAFDAAHKTRVLVRMDAATDRCDLITLTARTTFGNGKVCLDEYCIFEEDAEAISRAGDAILDDLNTMYGY